MQSLIVTYAGQPVLLDPDRRIRRYLRRWMPLEAFAARTFPRTGEDPGDWRELGWGETDGDLPRFNWSRVRPPRWELNTVWVPIGATRYPIALLLLTGTALKAGLEGGTNAVLVVEAAGERILDDLFLYPIHWARMGAPASINPSPPTTSTPDPADPSQLDEQAVYLVALVGAGYFLAQVTVSLDRPQHWQTIAAAVEERVRRLPLAAFSEFRIRWMDCCEHEAQDWPSTDTTSTTTTPGPTTTSTSSTTTSHLCTTQAPTTTTSEPSTTTTHPSSTTSTSTTTTRPYLPPDPKAWTLREVPAGLALDALAAGLGTICRVSPWSAELCPLEQLSERGTHQGQVAGDIDFPAPIRLANVVLPRCDRQGNVLPSSSPDVYRPTVHSESWAADEYWVYDRPCAQDYDCAGEVAQWHAWMLQRLPRGGVMQSWAATQIGLKRRGRIPCLWDWVLVDVQRGVLQVKALDYHAWPHRHAHGCPTGLGRNTLTSTTTTLPRPEDVATTTTPPCQQCDCLWRCVDGQLSQEWTQCEAPCVCPPPATTCAPSGTYTLIQDCVTTTTIGCLGECLWQWDATAKIWTLYENRCAPHCQCRKPNWCGSENCAAARTRCFDPQAENLANPDPDCGQTTSTSSTTTGDPNTTTSANPYPPGHPCNPAPTTTSTTGGPRECCCPESETSCHGCDWKSLLTSTGTLAWVLVSRDCCSTCPCPYPNRPPDNPCDFTHTDCQPVSTTTPSPCTPCAGVCHWIWSDLVMDWVYIPVYGGCPPAGILTCRECYDSEPCVDCRCARPPRSSHSPQCGEHVITPCECVCREYDCIDRPPGGIGTTTTTSTTPPPNCRTGSCVWTWDGTSWQYVQGHCPPECPCQAPYFTGELIGECAWTPCQGRTTTSTSSTTTTAGPTTTSTTTTTTTSCAGSCVHQWLEVDGGWEWVLLRQTCGEGCYCPPAPCGVGHAGEIVWQNCLSPSDASTTTTCPCAGYCRKEWVPYDDRNPWGPGFWNSWAACRSDGCVCQEICRKGTFPGETVLVPCVPPAEVEPCGCQAHSCDWRSDRDLQWHLIRDNCPPGCQCGGRPFLPPFYASQEASTPCQDIASTTTPGCRGRCTWRYDLNLGEFQLLGRNCYPSGACDCSYPEPPYQYEWVGDVAFVVTACGGTPTTSPPSTTSTTTTTSSTTSSTTSTTTSSTTTTSPPTSSTTSTTTTTTASTTSSTTTTTTTASTTSSTTTTTTSGVCGDCNCTWFWNGSSWDLYYGCEYTSPDCGICSCDPPPGSGPYYGYMGYTQCH